AARTHLGEAPDRDPAPALLRREEVPIGHGVAEGRVGDVVRCQPEGGDLQPRLSLLELGRRLLEEATAVEVVLGNEEVHVTRSLCLARGSWPAVGELRERLLDTRD